MALNPLQRKLLVSWLGWLFLLVTALLHFQQVAAFTAFAIYWHRKLANPPIPPVPQRLLRFRAPFLLITCPLAVAVVFDQNFPPGLQVAVLVSLWIAALAGLAWLAWIDWHNFKTDNFRANRNQ